MTTNILSPDTLTDVTELPDGFYDELHSIGTASNIATINPKTIPLKFTSEHFEVDFAKSGFKIVEGDGYIELPLFNKPHQLYYLSCPNTWKVDGYQVGFNSGFQIAHFEPYLSPTHGGYVVEETIYYRVEVAPELRQLGVAIVGGSFTLTSDEVINVILRGAHHELRTGQAILRLYPIKAIPITTELISPTEK